MNNNKLRTCEINEEKYQESGHMEGVKNCTPQPGGGTRPKGKLSKEQVTWQQAKHQDTRPSLHNFQHHVSEATLLISGR